MDFVFRKISGSPIFFLWVLFLDGMVDDSTCLVVSLHFFFVDKYFFILADFVTCTSSFNKSTVSSSSSSNALLCLEMSVQDWECCGRRTSFLNLEANLAFSRLLPEDHEDDLDEEVEEEEELKEEEDEELEEEEAEVVEDEELNEPEDDEHVDDADDETDEHEEEPADDMEAFDEVADAL